MKLFQNKKDLVVSYLTIRNAIGIIGIALPIVLLIGSVAIFNCNEIHQSISDYYHTRMRNVFVGSMYAVALFLFCYKGSGKENVFGNLGGIFALGVILFPTADDCRINCNLDLVVFNETLVNPELFGVFHLISALLFFVVLIIFSLHLFIEKADPENDNKLTLNQKRRNIVFRLCGYTMIASILAIGTYFIFFENEDCLTSQKIDFVFWMETLALWAFGTSWIVKGQLFWKDINEH
ncbi:MAG: hypothetical protein R2786_02280 [Flavobacteriaceae bacterium]